MAYGFRHVPERRTASDYDPNAHCSNCGARVDGGHWPHFCKETTPGTVLAPTVWIPFTVTS